MSVENVLARIAELHQGLVPPSTAAQGAANGAQFASMLQGQTSSAGVASAAGAATPLGFSGAVGATGTAVATPGQRALALAQGEVGQTEQPPGSNDSPRIADYRASTAGAGIGPWCAYFVSWVAQQAGTPLGDSGQGFGSVDQLYAWAQHNGRAVPNGPGVVPRPGDLIVFDEHIGIVEQVLPGGRIQTLEGNSSDRVSRNVHDFSDALGYVRMS